MDVIRIQGFKLPLICGILESEQKFVQIIEIDVDIFTDFKSINSSSSIDETINYAAVLTSLEEELRPRKFSLLEELGNHIASHLLSKYQVAGVELEVKKLNPPVPQDVKYTSVKLRRMANE